MASHATVLPPSEDITTDSVPDPPRDVNTAPVDSSVNNKVEEEIPQKSSENITETQKQKKDEHLKPPSNDGTSRSRSQSPGDDVPKSAKRGAKKKKSAGNVEYHIQNASNVHIGSSYTLVMSGGAKNGRTTVNSEKEQVREFYNELKNKDDRVTTTHIRMVSPHVGENWRDVGRNLYFTDGRLGQIKTEKIEYGMKEVVYQILLEWTRNNGSGATVGNLSRALWKSEEYSAIKILASPQEDDD